MKFFLLKSSIILLLILFSNNAYAGIDQSINDFLAPISQIISSIVFYTLPVGNTNVELIVIWLLSLIHI